ncbi:MAG: hypothetical protein Q7I92_07250 [Humidesulfovibrio sp.]|nr:hypothetical protein [Humidesulfovibrio sp.]
MAMGNDRWAALRALADAIAATLARGLPQDQGTLDTVLAALGDPDEPGKMDIRTALALLAADPEASEHAPLLALLLSPDPSVLRGLEPALALADLRADEALALAERVVERLAGDQERAPVLLSALLPDGSRAELYASADGVRAFVRRLRPEATAPEELRGIIARRFTPELGAELSVILRHCRLGWTPGHVFFLGTLLERAEPRADDLPGLLAWAAGFLEDVDAEPGSSSGSAPGRPPDLRGKLAARRQALQSQLRQAEFMEEAMARGNYETLMSQGLRFAHVHGPDVRDQLAFLERAARLALGLAGEALDGVSVRDLGRAEDAEELLRLLPGLDDQGEG